MRHIDENLYAVMTKGLSRTLAKIRELGPVFAALEDPEIPYENHTEAYQFAESCPMVTDIRQTPKKAVKKKSRTYKFN